MKPEAERKRIAQETWSRGLEANRVTALLRAYYTLAKYIPEPPEVFLPKPIYKIVIRRLKGLYPQEKLSRIHLSEDV